MQSGDGMEPFRTIVTNGRRRMPDFRARKVRQIAVPTTLSAARYRLLCLLRLSGLEASLPRLHLVGRDRSQLPMVIARTHPLFLPFNIITSAIGA
jgi:hypothetical protein